MQLAFDGEYLSDLPIGVKFFVATWLANLGVKEFLGELSDLQLIGRLGFIERIELQNDTIVVVGTRTCCAVEFAGYDYSLFPPIPWLEKDN